MLIQLGERSCALDAADLLVECHGRLRRFIELANRLVRSRPPPHTAAAAGE